MPQEIQDTANERLATALPDIEAHTNQFFATQGRYWQGLTTHAVPPRDGEHKRPDVGAKTPSDQGNPWPVKIRNNNEPMAYTVDVYEGPEGHGYAVTVAVEVTGAAGIEEWTRTVGYGPEPWTHDWQLTPERTAQSPGTP